LDWSLIGPPSRDHIAVAFSADGQSIATIEYDSAVVRVVSAADGTLLREMSSSYTGYACLACSPDGSLLAAGTMGNDARPPAVVVWDFNTGQVVHTLLGHTGQITSVAFSPDRAHLASGSAPTYDRTSDSTVRIWDDRTGALVEVLSGLSAERAPVDKLAYSPGGDLLVTGHPDGSVLLRRLSDQSIVFLWTQEYALDVRGLAYSPDGTMIAATGPSPPLRVWDVRTGNLLFNPMPGYGFGTFAAFSPDGRALACSISDPHEAILFYQTSDFSLLLEYDSGISTDPRAFSFAPHGNSFAHGREGTIGVYRSPAAPCRADWNVDGVLDAMDFFAFVDSFLNCDSEIACSRDFNRDGVVDSQDFFDFVSAFFAGCE
jgi:WD40 repeat protein